MCSVEDPTRGSAHLKEHLCQCLFLVIPCFWVTVEAVLSQLLPDLALSPLVGTANSESGSVIPVHARTSQLPAFVELASVSEYPHTTVCDCVRGLVILIRGYAGISCFSHPPTPGGGLKHQQRTPFPANCPIIVRGVHNQLRPKCPPKRPRGQELISNCQTKRLADWRCVFENAHVCSVSVHVFLCV